MLYLKKVSHLSKKVVCVVLLSFSLFSSLEYKSNAGNQLKFAKSLVGEVMSLIENEKMPANTKKQAIVDKYVNVIDFEWNAKTALGRPYLSLNKAEQKQYVNEYAKYLAYTWLPKLEFPKKNSGIKVSILDKIKKINQTDEVVVLEVKLGDGTTYDINIKIREKDGKCKLLNVDMVGIDLALSYRMKFEGIIEQNGGKAQSVIKYLEEQNVKNQKTAGFVLNMK